MTPHQDARHSIVDDNRSACLCDVGLPGFVAATCINNDGRAHLVIIDGSLVGDESSAYNPQTPSAPHEQPGALPEQYVRRIAQQPGGAR